MQIAKKMVSKDKIVQIRSYFWSVFSCVRTEYGPEITLYLDTFHAVIILSHNWCGRLSECYIKLVF